jgi:hypothetical protein
LDAFRVVLIVVLGNALVWGLFFYQRGRRIAKTRMAVERSGETWVIPPENAFYQGFRGPVSVKTMGAIGLTPIRVIFIPPLGRNMEYPLKDVVEVSENTWFHGNYRDGRPYMILKLADGKEVGFQTRNHQRWIEEVKSRMPSPS